MAEWWTSQEAGLYAGIGGGLVGVIGAVIGVAMGVLAPRGVGRAFVIGALYLLTFAGGVALGIGVLAVLVRQPYHVYYPLLLGGGVMAVVMGALIPTARHVYRRAERNRLGAEELRRT